MHSQSFQTYQHSLGDAFITLVSAQSQALRDLAALNTEAISKLPTPDISDYNARLQSLTQQTLEAQKEFGQQHVAALKDYGSEVIAQVKDTFSSAGLEEILTKSKAAFGVEDAIVKTAVKPSKR